MEILELLSHHLFFVATACVVLGGALGWVFYVAVQAGIRKAAQTEAQEILQESKERQEIQLLEEKERIQEIETELWTREEAFLLKTEERIEELEELAQEKKQKSDNQYSVERQKTVTFENEVVAEEKRIAALEKKLSLKKGTLKDLNQQMIDRLATKLSATRDQVITEIIEEFVQEENRHAASYVEQIVEDAKEHSESYAKYLIDQALCRFARPYSAERGIAPVYFETPEQRQVLLDAEGKNIQTISEITGCDIYVEEGMDLVGVAGFDPVRREMTRRILERCLKERRPVNPQFIKEKAEHIKRELLATIKRDGDLIAKELKLEGMHPEIRQMMGSLRYRYSFTQNQYFHCGEVGFLAGLLAQELGTVPVRKARRSGLLHDLGKSMDHELDGGHAVIGANFIEQRGEAPDVVHAVRAHHFDVQPDQDLDFLVIAADAISGSRPGARRSTIESYNQKVSDLQDIARSFNGVTDCFVLSGGRECRVVVNGKILDDMGALKLGEKIAKRIEEECNYPGQIKVVVVRESYTFETTRAHA